MVVAFAKPPSIKVEICRDMKGSHLTKRIIFKLKSDFFFRSFSYNAPAKQLTFHHKLENNVQSPIRTYPIIALNEH